MPYCDVPVILFTFLFFFIGVEVRGRLGGERGERNAVRIYFCEATAVASGSLASPSGEKTRGSSRSEADERARNAPKNRHGAVFLLRASVVVDSFVRLHRLLSTFIPLS